MTWKIFEITNLQQATEIWNPCTESIQMTAFQNLTRQANYVTKMNTLANHWVGG